jgi:hypothetical protein
MRHLVDAVRRSVAENNWYAALTGALALPDIAGKWDGGVGGSASQARFVAWYNTYLLPRYTRPGIGGGQPQIILSGNDCYALRCAYLHGGEFDITAQRARQALDSFRFVAPPPGWHIHCNRNRGMLQLQVDVFCEDVCAALDAWLNARGGDPAVAAALAELPEIEIITSKTNPNIQI